MKKDIDDYVFWPGKLLVGCNKKLLPLLQASALIGVKLLDEPMNLGEVYWIEVEVPPGQEDTFVVYYKNLGFQVERSVVHKLY